MNKNFNDDEAAELGNTLDHKQKSDEGEGMGESEGSSTGPGGMGYGEDEDLNDQETTAIGQGESMKTDQESGSEYIDSATGAQGSESAIGEEDEYGLSEPAGFDSKQKRGQKSGGGASGNQGGNSSRSRKGPSKN